MALPASGPISSSQVATEFDVSQTDISLSNLGTKLTDSIGAGNPVNLAASFYGQSYSPCTEFECTTDPAKGGVEGACEQDPDTTYFHNGSGEFPEPGDNVFGNASCTIPLNDGAYKLGNGTVMIVGEGGVVEDITEC